MASISQLIAHGTGHIGLPANCHDNDRIQVEKTPSTYVTEQPELLQLYMVNRCQHKARRLTLACSPILRSVRSRSQYLDISMPLMGERRRLTNLPRQVLLPPKERIEITTCTSRFYHPSEPFARSHLHPT